MAAADWKARVEASGAFNSVRLELDFERALGSPAALPAAFLAPVSRSAGPNTLAGGQVSQLDEREVAVFVAAQALGEGAGDAAAERIEVLVAKVDAALVGWTPPGALGPVTAAGGGLQEIVQGVHIWRLSYRAPHLLRGGMGAAA